MKNLRVIIAWLLLITLLAGCSGGYRYVENGENSYLILGTKEPSDDEKNLVANKGVAPVVYFSSMAEMKSDIEKGNFTKEELLEIERFDKDDKGNVLVCSTNKLYEPTFPTRFTLGKVSWTGDSYAFYLNEKNGTEDITFVPRTRTYAENLIESDYTNPGFGGGAYRTEAVPEVGGKAYYYTDLLGENRKDVFYTVTTGDTTLYVVEYYKPDTLGEALYKIKVFGVNNRQCFEFFYYGDENSTRPTMDELKAFGIREYVETATE